MSPEALAAVATWCLALLVVLAAIKLADRWRTHMRHRRYDGGCRHHPHTCERCRPRINR